MKLFCPSAFKVTLSRYVLIVLALAHTAAAQEFYPKNFVQEQRSQGTPQQAKQQTAPQQPSTPNPLAAVMPLKEKIQALVYVNSSNKEHFDRVITRVLAIQRQRKIHIYAVMHLGDYRNIDPKQQQELSNAGIIVAALTNLPEKLPVTKSPTWGMMTAESRVQGLAYLIEGYMEPELFFNQIGQFEIPAGMGVGNDTQQQGKLAAF